MLKRIIINIILAFGILPAVNPFLVYLNALIFNYNFSKTNFFSQGTYHLIWSGVLFFYSIFILIFVFGIYNICIIAKTKNTKNPFSLGVKFIIFLILLSLLSFFYDSDFYRLGGHDILLQKIIVLIVLSGIMVTLHYFLIDRKYEKRISGTRIMKTEK